MDKKKTSSAVQCLNHERQGRQKKEPAEHSSSSLISPDPPGSSQTLRGNQSGMIPKETVTNTNGAPGGQGEVTKRQGYSRRDRETSKKNDSHGPVVVKKSLDTHQKGFRGTQSPRNSADKSKPAQASLVPFEVNVTDFPELAVHSPVHGVCWGPTPQPMNPLTQASFSWMSGRRRSPKQPDSLQISTNAEPDSSTASPVQTVVTSWANVASQPPKKAVPKEKSSTHIQMEEIAGGLEDGAGKKKRKKKKKRATGAGADVESESDGPAIYQELPKFEDEEEFPGLTLAQTRNERFITSRNDTKLCNEENQRVVQHQSADETKEISPALHAQPTEAAKKGQRAEKVSGKKSKVPVQLDIGNMLDALEKKQQSQKTKQDTKPVILSVTGGLPVVQKQPLVPKKPPWQQGKIAHNPLDSTSPLVKKGKQREVPKAKKPTPLKKIILKEREERKQRRLLVERGLLPELELQPANDAAEVEQSDTNATDVFGNPAEEINDESKVKASNQTVKDGGEEADDKDKGTQQQTITSVPLPAYRPKIHSRKFRDYCSQMLSKDVDECVTSLLKELVRFQDRLYQKDPMKARMKRRIVMGLREVLKHLKLRKVKCVVISPNCERIQSKGGLDEALYTIIDTCREQGVPFVFALSRKALGRCVSKAVPVSLVGIFNYDGAQDFYHNMIELSSEARRAYEVMVSSLEWTGQAEEEQAVNSEERSQICSLSEEAEANSDNTEPEEPEHIKIWKKMLEKDCYHKSLNIEERLSSMCLENECTENTEEERS